KEVPHGTASVREARRVLRRGPRPARPPTREAAPLPHRQAGGTHRTGRRQPQNPSSRLLGCSSPVRGLLLLTPVPYPAPGTPLRDPMPGSCLGQGQSTCVTGRPLGCLRVRCLAFVSISHFMKEVRHGTASAREVRRVARRGADLASLPTREEAAL